MQEIFNAITNPAKLVHSLITTEGHTTKSTHAGKLQITEGSHPMFFSALVVSGFEDNLKSAGKITKAHDVLFTGEGVFLKYNGKPYTSAKLVGGRGPDNLYKFSMENVRCTY